MEICSYQFIWLSHNIIEQYHTYTIGVAKISQYMYKYIMEEFHIELLQQVLKNKLQR